MHVSYHDGDGTLLLQRGLHGFLVSTFFLTPLLSPPSFVFSFSRSHSPGPQVRAPPIQPPPSSSLLLLRRPPRRPSSIPSRSRCSLEPRASSAGRTGRTFGGPASRLTARAPPAPRSGLLPLRFLCSFLGARPGVCSLPLRLCRRGTVALQSCEGAALTMCRTPPFPQRNTTFVLTPRRRRSLLRRRRPAAAVRCCGQAAPPHGDPGSYL